MKLEPSKTLLSIWKALPPKLGSVVGEEATLSSPELERVWSPAGQRYYAELELVEPRVCKLWMSFALPLAIASAGHLVMRPKAAIRSNIESNTFEGDDLDAMGECVNTFCTALNEAIREDLGADHRIVFRAGSKEPPDTGDAGPLSVARGRLVFGDLASGELELVIPDAVFVAASEVAEDSREEDEEEEEASDEDLGADDEDDDDAEQDAEEGKSAPSGKRRAAKKKKKKAGETREESGGQSEPGPDAAHGALLSREELAAIREATSSLKGLAVIIADRESARENWRTSLAGTGIEMELVANHHQALAVCRARQVDVVVIDADACSSGGLSLLAAIRGGEGVPRRRVVIASAATHSHLVSCFAGGASEYVTRPLADDALARLLESA